MAVPTKRFADRFEIGATLERDRAHDRAVARRGIGRRVVFLWFCKKISASRPSGKRPIVQVYRKPTSSSNVSPRRRFGSRSRRGVAFMISYRALTVQHARAPTVCRCGRFCRRPCDGSSRAMQRLSETDFAPSAALRPAGTSDGCPKCRLASAQRGRRGSAWIVCRSCFDRLENRVPGENPGSRRESKIHADRVGRTSVIS
jgi:hypothetical protein